MSKVISSTMEGERLGLCRPSGCPARERTKSAVN